MASTLAGDSGRNRWANADLASRIAVLQDTSKDRQVGWALWVGFLVIMCAWVTFGPKRSVTPAYFFGAEQWVAGRPLYNPEGIGFLYLPQAAILFTPFAALPVDVAEIAWRVVSVGVYAWGVRRLVGLAERCSGCPLFTVTTLIVLPLALSSTKSGQATLPMAGLMMAAVAYLVEKNWWRAAGCLALAVAIKPLAVVLILLAAATYRPLIGRLFVALAILALAPFLTQSPGYVQSQFMAFPEAMQYADQRSHVEYFAQLFGLLRVIGWDVSGAGKMLARGAVAIITLLSCLWCSRRIDAARWGVYFYTLSTCYLMLFNPRTENNSYSMLAPAIGIFCAWALREQRRKRLALLAVVFWGTLCTFEFARLFTPKEQCIWLAPAMCLVFASCVITDLIQERSPAAQHLAAE